MKKTKFLSVLLTVIFLFSLSTDYAYAKYKDKSGDLPGMADDSEITTLLVVGGVLITGMVVYLLVRKSKRNKSASSIMNPNGSSTLLLTDSNKNQVLYNEFRKAAEQSPVQLFTQSNTFNKQQNLDLQAVSVGLRFKF